MFTVVRTAASCCRIMMRSSAAVQDALDKIAVSEVVVSGR